MSEFLAEASILIQANTVAFRKELADALAIVPKAIEIPIIAVAQTGTARSAAATLAQEASVSASVAAEKAAVQTAAASKVSTAALSEETPTIERAAVVTQEYTAAKEQGLLINRALAATEQAVAVANLEVVGAASSAEAAEIKRSRAAQAGVAARDLLTKAQLAGLNVENLLRNSIVSTAVAYGEEAAAAESSAAVQTAASRTASAAATQAAIRNAEVTKGIQAQALSAAGLRGAIIGANPAFLAATAGAILFGKAIKTAVSFESELNVFKVTIGATADEMTRVSQAAQQLGRDVTLPGVSAGDAAEAMTELAKAGLNVEDSISGARGVLQLATAAQISNADATKIAAGALNAFGLAGNQAVHVADLLANAANNAQGSIGDMGIALSQSEAVARQVGISLDDTVTLLTLLAKNGLQGSDAGTALRTSLIRLINPTAKAKAVLADLNIQLRDQAGNIRPEVFADFAKATETLTASQRDAKAAIVFGQDAIRAEAILGREGAAGLNAMRDANEKQGTAAEVAGARNAGLAGDMANLQNQLEATGLVLGQLSVGPLSLLVKSLSVVTNETNLFIQTLKKIPGSIPVPKIDVGPVDTEKQSKDLADKLKGALPSIAAFGAKSLITGGPTGAIGLTILENLFPPKAQVDAQGKKTGAEVASAIEDAGRAAVRAASDSGHLINSALKAAFSLANEELSAAISAGRAKLIQAIQGSQGQQKGLDDLMNQILLGGGSPQQQIANLDKQFKTQQSIIDKATTGLKGLTSGDKGFATLTEAVRTARDKQVQINGQIEGIQGQITSDQTARTAKAQQAAAAAQQARNDADQAVLDSFLPAEQRLDVREATAQASGVPQQLKAVAIARKKQLLSEIKQIQDNFNDTKNAKALIAAKRVQIVNLDAQITADITAIFTQGQQDRADALQSQVNVAQAEGNIPLQIRLNNVLIAAINKKIASDKLVGKALNDAKAQRATLQAANQGLRDQQIQNQIALGQSIADLTGNKDQLIAALDAAIAADRARVAALKKAGKSSTVVQTELNGFLQQRKEALKKATDDAKDVQGRGTTAFDLLKQANDTFNQNAGNLINPSQPFAGPTGFTADIAQFLIRRQPTTAPSTSRADFTAPLVSSNAELITVIKENTDALRGKTDKSGPVSSGRTTQHPRVWAADSFWARHLQEA